MRGWCWLLHSTRNRPHVAPLKPLLEALRELAAQNALCLISTDDEAYTYNKRVNRLATVQEHFMILRALERGVPRGQASVHLRRASQGALRQHVGEGVDTAIRGRDALQAGLGGLESIGMAAVDGLCIGPAGHGAGPGVGFADRGRDPGPVAQPAAGQLVAVRCS